ncbi:hypothetical protein IFM89_036638 [Coptis chinensis]|uniref:Uncharacterized protein n=1 Tax=Coptis chinensis TaxID=261450 RepID=A0A835HHH8_9MAGN|nr:hypothetical protein IFM89_036638 [Coptis chinensis]
MSVPCVSKTISWGGRSHPADPQPKQRCDGQASCPGTLGNAQSLMWVGGAICRPSSPKKACGVGRVVPDAKAQNLVCGEKPAGNPRVQTMCVGQVVLSQTLVSKTLCRIGSVDHRTVQVRADELEEQFAGYSVGIKYPGKLEYSRPHTWGMVEVSMVGLLEVHGQVGVLFDSNWRYSLSVSGSSDDSSSDSYSSSSDSDSSPSDSSSSDGRRRRKKTSKTNSHRRGRKKWDVRRERRRRRHNKRSKRKSKRGSDSSSDLETDSGISESDDDVAHPQESAPAAFINSLHNESSKSRSSSPTPKRYQSTSPRRSSGTSPRRSPRKSSRLRSISPAGRYNRQTNRSYSGSPRRSPPRKAPEPPVASSRRSLSRSRSPDGNPKRIRRGRGFTERYASARKYRTPSPERSPPRPYRYGGRNIQERNRDRYSGYRGYRERSPLRRIWSPPRRRSPARYQSRRSRSRSISRSPRHSNGRVRDHSRSPRHSRSSVDGRSSVSERLQSRLGPRGGESHPSDKKRSRSRSKSPSRSRSRSLSRSASSADGSPRKPVEKAELQSPSRSRSSSPVGNRGLVSYGDLSPDIGEG